jgi:transposase-like protein
MFILPGVTGLLQHLKHLTDNLNIYRPEFCPHCGMAGLWCWGYYYRKPDRHSDSSSSLNPIPIPRFFCSHCGRTMSVLPECVAPRRWYMWLIQQDVLLQILQGKSFRQISNSVLVARSTCRRWRNRFKDKYLLHGSTLRNYYPELGYQENFNSFWPACFQKISLSKAMLLCHQSGVQIP